MVSALVKSPWLHIVGIGEDGMEGLVPATRAVVEAADIIIGGDRHHKLSINLTAIRIAWPSPFDVMIETLQTFKEKRVVILVTGDPLWFSVGARIGREIPTNELVYHPQLSAFQLAAARMGWSLADVETLTVHGRPVEQMIAFIQPDQQLIVLTTGAETPGQIAKFLTERGFGSSKMTVLAAMGGMSEQRFDGPAHDWSHKVPAFNTLCIDCVAAPDAALLPAYPVFQMRCSCLMAPSPNKKSVLQRSPNSCRCEVHFCGTLEQEVAVLLLNGCAPRDTPVLSASNLVQTAAPWLHKTPLRLAFQS